MKKIKKIIEVDKYEAFVSYPELTFDDIFYNENIEVMFNTNNTGGDNFLDFKEYNFETIEDIKEMANERKFSVISLYQENGYIGVYQNSSDDALKVKCNNWVDYERNGFLYVAFYNNNNDLKDLIARIQSYINRDFYEVHIIDNEIDKIVDSMLIATTEDTDYLETFLGKYEIKKIND